MELKPNQKEALTRLINIGYNHAAASLSDITGLRVSFEVPQVAVQTVPEIAGKFPQTIQGQVAAVNQFFSGQINGNAILLLDREAALALNSLLTDRPITSEFDGAAKEIITEVGNILLNACLGTFGNLLNVEVSFSVPFLQVNSVNKVIHSLTAENQPGEYALVVQTCFHLREKDIEGFLVIILGVASLAALFEKTERWIEREADLNC